MNVLYLVRVWPFVRADYLFRELAWMRARGHAVAVAALESLTPEIDGHPILPAYGLADVPELLLDDDPDPLERILAFVRAQKADLIDAHDGRRPAELALDLARRTGIPYSVRFHGGDLHSSPSPRLGEIVAGARAVCPISRYLADVLTGGRESLRNPPHVPVAVDRAKLRVCPHGMPAQRIADAPPPHERDLVIGTISRLDDPGKCGPFDLIDAFAAIAGEHPRVTLRFIGGGELQPEMESHARTRGIAGRMTITGFVPWPDALRMASELGVFVHGSEVEGFCLPVLEAAACGLPLAVTPTGANEELVDHGVNGYLFDFGDSAALADRLRMLLSGDAESRRRMGRASLARVRERFVFESTMARIENILIAAAEGGPLPA